MGRGPARPAPRSLAGLQVTHILDASVILAYFRREAGADRAAVLLPDAQISAVSMSETASKLIDFGQTPEAAWHAMMQLGLAVHAFDTEAAKTAASLRPVSRPYGLSFADCACLALGLKLALPVYTADRAWGKLQIGVDVRLIR